MFEAILGLRQRIGIQNKIEAVHGSHVWTAEFEWKPPGGEWLKNDLKISGIPFPKDYLEFLTGVANGCLIYYDRLYGQWGYKIYSFEELAEKQVVWKARLGADWQENFLIFAEMHGESHGLLFDLSKPSRDMISCTIFEANPIDTVGNWFKVSRTFHEWLDHLVTAQGDKYWEWK